MRISQNLSSFYRPLTLCDVNIARIEQVIYYLGRMDFQRNGKILLRKAWKLCKKTRTFYEKYRIFKNKCKILAIKFKEVFIRLNICIEDGQTETKKYSKRNQILFIKHLLK